MSIHFDPKSVYHAVYEEPMLIGLQVFFKEDAGEFGNRIEELLGPHAIPLMAARRLEPGKLYSIGSCRRDQGLVWKKLGGIVVQIDNPAVAPSQYDFDRFDEGLADCVITNDLSRFPTPELNRIALAGRLDQLMHRCFDLKLFAHGAAA